MQEKMIDIAIRFTETYKQYKDVHPAIREAKVLEVLYPDSLKPMSENDFFAGDTADNLAWPDVIVDCAPYYRSQIGYTLRSIDEIREVEQVYPHRADDIEELIEFWKKESTFVKLLQDAEGEVAHYLYPRGKKHDKDGYLRSSGKKKLGAGIMSGSYDSRIAGLMPDFDKLMRLGIPGLREEIEKAAKEKPDCKDFYTAALICMDIMTRTCEDYRVQAAELAESTVDGDKKAKLSRCEKALYNLQKRSPETLYEGIQLVIIYCLLTHTHNYGRLDVSLGDLLVNDLEQGVLDENEVIEIMVHFWQVLSRLGNNYDSRVIIGGLGRRNEENADRFAMYAMEATRLTHDIKPVLTLRMYDGQNPQLFDKAIEVIGEGCIYPTLYNDDRFVPGVMQSMNLSYDEAVRYVPLGCGELTLESCCTGSPNSTIRFLKILEVVLHNGCDGVDGYPLGIQTGELSEFTTYEKLEQAFYKQVSDVLRRDVALHRYYRDRTAKYYTAIMQSLLTDDCIARGKSIFEGGIRYFGANAEGFGVTNTVNSLIAIKKLVYEYKEYTLEEFVHILDVDFEGYESARERMLSMPKYGNGDAEVDEMKLRLEHFINDTAHSIGEATDLAYYTVANVNPGGITIGPSVGASADGRKCGVFMAVGNSPHPGSDINGLTAMLLSAARSSDNRNGGYVTNMNLSREAFVNNPEKIKSAFRTYFKMGGLQLNINCFSKGDLEKAIEHPEDYRNLIVRVSGYSARFVDLNHVTQRHIMERTLF